MRRGLIQLLTLFLKSRDREALLHDMEELAEHVAETRGEVTASLWILGQVLRSLIPVMMNGLMWRGRLLANGLWVALRTVGRQKTVSLLHTGGLVIGFTSSLLILLYVGFESGFDRFHSQSGRTYRLQYNTTRQGETSVESAVSIPAIAPALTEAFPEVEAWCRVTRAFLENGSFAYGEERFRENGAFFVTADFLSMFDFPLIYGDRKTALSGTRDLVMTRSSVRRYFGRDAEEFNPVGEILHWKGIYGDLDLRVTGVCEDVPPNSHLQFDFLMAYPALGEITPFDTGREESESSWDWSYFYTYIRLHDGVDARTFQEKIGPWLAGLRGEAWKRSGTRQEFRLQPLTSLHLDSRLREEADPDGQGDRKIVNVLLGVALAVLVLAWINTMNLSTARMLERSKEIGLRKVTGAGRWTLVGQIFLEYLLVLLFALFVSLLAVHFLAPLLGALTGGILSFGYLKYVPGFGRIVLIVMAGALVTGLYPALLISSLRPVTVLAGRWSRTPRGGRVRKLLMVLQLALSFGLIASTGIVWFQMDAVLKQDLGFDTDRILVLRGTGSGAGESDSLYSRRIEGFRNALLSRPGIEQVSSASNVPGEEIYIVNWVKADREDAPWMRIQLVVADTAYVPALNLHLAAGRNFSRYFGNEEASAMINEEAVRRLGFGSPEKALGRQIIRRHRPYTVTGVVKDYHQMSLKNAVGPVLLIYGERRSEFFVVRLRGARFREGMECVRTLWDRYNPDTAMDSFFLDDFFNSQYRSEIRFRRVFSLFALLSLSIACIGLLGLALFHAAGRIKEIGIRKSLGASVGQIFWLMIREYLLLGLVGSLMAAPLVYDALGVWLSRFVVRAPVRLWIFPASWMLVNAVILISVSIQAARASRARPVDALRYE